MSCKWWLLRVSVRGCEWLDHIALRIICHTIVTERRGGISSIDTRSFLAAPIVLAHSLSLCQADLTWLTHLLAASIMCEHEWNQRGEERLICRRNQCKMPENNAACDRNSCHSSTLAAHFITAARVFPRRIHRRLFANPAYLAFLRWIFRTPRALFFTLSVRFLLKRSLAVIHLAGGCVRVQIGFIYFRRFECTWISASECENHCSLVPCWGLWRSCGARSLLQIIWIKGECMCVSVCVRAVGWLAVAGCFLRTAFSSLTPRTAQIKWGERGR